MKNFSKIKPGSIIVYEDFFGIKDCHVGIVIEKEHMKDIPGIGDAYIVKVHNSGFPISRIVKVICE